MNRNTGNWMLLAGLLVLGVGVLTFWQSGGTPATAAPGEIELAAPDAQATATPTRTPTITPTPFYDTSNVMPQDGRLITSNGTTINQGDVLRTWATSGIPAVVATPLPTWTPQPNVFSGTPVPVRGQQVASVATIIRPTGTPSPYPTLGAINQSATTPVALTFQNVCRVQGGSATITLLRMLTDQSTNTARYRLHLYNAAPTPFADTAAFTLLYANAATRVGYIDVYALQTEGSGSTAAHSNNPDIRLPVICAPGDTNLYGQLETIDNFTPAAGQQFYLSLAASQD